MARTVLMIGTRKGLWIATQRRRRPADVAGARAPTSCAARCTPSRSTPRTPPAGTGPGCSWPASTGTGGRRCCTATTSARPGRRAPTARSSSRRTPAATLESVWAIAPVAVRPGRGVGRHGAVGAVPLDRRRRHLHDGARPVGPPAPRAVGRRLRRPGDPHRAAAPHRPAAGDRGDVDRRRLPHLRRRRAPGRPPTRASAPIFLPEGAQFPEFGQCVHKVARDPARPRPALPPEPRRRLPQRRRRRLVDVDRRRAARATSGSRSSPTRTSPAPCGCSRSRAPTAASRSRAKCSVWRSRDAGESWEPLRDRAARRVLHRRHARRHVRGRRRRDRRLLRQPRRQVFGSDDEGDTWRAGAEHLPDVLCVRAAVV